MFAVGGGLFLLKNLFCYFMGVEMIVGKPAYEIVGQRPFWQGTSGRSAQLVRQRVRKNLEVRKEQILQRLQKGPNGPF